MDKTEVTPGRSRRLMLDPTEHELKQRRFRPMSPSRFLEARVGMPFLAPLAVSQGAPGGAHSQTALNAIGNSKVITPTTIRPSSAAATPPPPPNPAFTPVPGKERIDAVLDSVAQLYYRKKDLDSVGVGNPGSSQEYDYFNYPTLHLLLTPLRQPSILDYWTPHEIVLFEAGLCSIGKNFHQLHKLIKTKTPNEIVDFYYAWKRSSHYSIWKHFEKVTRKFHTAKFEHWDVLDKVMDRLLGPVSTQPYVAASLGGTEEVVEEEDDDDDEAEEKVETFVVGKGKVMTSTSNSTTSSGAISSSLLKERETRQQQQPSSQSHHHQQQSSQYKDNDDEVIGNRRKRPTTPSGGGTGSDGDGGDDSVNEQPPSKKRKR